MDIRPRLRDDPELAATTFVVIDFETTTPTGARPEPIDVATVQLRLAGRDWTEQHRFSRLMRPPGHASITAFDTLQTGITAQMVANADPATQVLAELDHQIREDHSYLLVAHNAHTEAAIIHDYRQSCPKLAHLDLLDTVRIARALYPDLGSHKLDVLLHHLQIPIPADRHRAMPDVQVTAALFGRMLAHGDSTRTWATLADLRRTALIVAKANRPHQDSLFDKPDFQR
jgi:DNA polymerase-3 subunit epsilon